MNNLVRFFQQTFDRLLFGNPENGTVEETRRSIQRDNLARIRRQAFRRIM